MGQLDLEGRLRGFRPKQPPPGLRARLLARAEEVAAQRARGPRWRLRLALAAAVIIALAGDLAAERITDARIAALGDGHRAMVVQRSDAAIRATMRERDRLLAALLSKRDWQ